MTARRLADVLVSFDIEAVARDPRDEEEDVRSDATPPAIESDTEAQLAAAREEGFASGSARAAADHATILEDERRAFTRRLEAERAGWAAAEGAVLAEKVRLGLAELESRIGASTARILRGLLAEHLVERAIEELAAHVRALLSGTGGKVVEISGPEDLVAALRGKLEGASAAIEYRPAAGADVRIVCDDTIVESRLSAWLARLASAEE